MAQLFDELAQLYKQMEEAYGKVALLLDFTCDGCPDNCCDSYFTHHTYIEWAYLWDGFKKLPEEKQKVYLQRAVEYVEQSEKDLADEKRPAILCPLNDDGRCALYEHRLLICRMHGVPTSFTLPDGQKKRFPGCFRCQEQTAGRGELPTMDRTKFFREMVGIEHEFLAHKIHILPKLKMTIAEMLVKGKPEL